MQLSAVVCVGCIFAVSGIGSVAGSILRFVLVLLLVSILGRIVCIAVVISIAVIVTVSAVTVIVLHDNLRSENVN